MIQARERQRQKEGCTLKASQVRVGCCRTHYHRRRGRSKASNIQLLMVLAINWGRGEGRTGWSMREEGRMRGSDW